MKKRGFYMSNEIKKDLMIADILYDLQNIINKSNLEYEKLTIHKNRMNVDKISRLFNKTISSYMELFNKKYVFLGINEKQHLHLSDMLSFSYELNIAKKKLFETTSQQEKEQTQEKVLEVGNHVYNCLQEVQNNLKSSAKKSKKQEQTQDL